MRYLYTFILALLAIFLFQQQTSIAEEVHFDNQTDEVVDIILALADQSVATISVAAHSVIAFTTGAAPVLQAASNTTTLPTGVITPVTLSSGVGVLIHHSTISSGLNFLITLDNDAAVRE